MCFLMSNRCHVLIITPITAGRCSKTASSSGSLCTLWFCVFVLRSQCMCEHDSCVCVCMRGLFFYICVCVCVCVRQAMLHYAHNAMIIHGILGTWNWMTIYFPELFPFHTRCSLLSSSNFTSISPPRLACPRSTEMCEVCVECKCEWRSGVLPCHSVWPCHTLAVWSSSDMPSGPAHQL